MPMTNCDGLELLVLMCNWDLQMLKISYMQISLKSNFYT